MPRQPKQPPNSPAIPSDYRGPDIRCAYTRIVPLSELKPRPNNPNRHPEAQLEAYAKIVDHQGIRKPLIVSLLSGYIATGHGLYETALRRGWTHLPIDEQTYRSESEELAHLVADNKLPELAEVDDVFMAGILSDLEASGFDLDLTGFDDLEIGDLLDEKEPPAVRVKRIEIKPFPKIAWALIGVPVDDFGPVQEFLETLPDRAIITTTISDRK